MDNLRRVTSQQIPKQKLHHSFLKRIIETMLSRLILFSALFSSLHHLCVLGFVPQSKISISSLSTKLSRHDINSSCRPTKTKIYNKYFNERNLIKKSVAFNNSELKSSTYDNDSSSGDNNMNGGIDPVIRDVATRLRRVNWFSWWSQVVLTVISSITLLFARSVLNALSSAYSTTPSTAPGGFLFAGSGKGLYFYSIQM